MKREHEVCGVGFGEDWSGIGYGCRKGRCQRVGTLKMKGRG